MQIRHCTRSRSSSALPAEPVELLDEPDWFCGALYGGGTGGVVALVVAFDAEPVPLTMAPLTLPAGLELLKGTVTEGGGAGK